MRSHTLRTLGDGFDWPYPRNCGTFPQPWQRTTRTRCDYLALGGVQVPCCHFWAPCEHSLGLPQDVRSGPQRPHSCAHTAVQGRTASTFTLLQHQRIVSKTDMDFEMFSS
ncbi:unnamed protein product [Ixodes persulcatus]